MSTETSWVRDVARGRRGKAMTGVQGFEDQGGEFKLVL